MACAIGCAHERWASEIGFGIYAAGLTSVAVVVATLALRPILYRNQLSQLDEQLAQDAMQVFADLENYRDSQVNFRKPIAPKFLPVSVRLRYLQLISVILQNLEENAAK